MLVTLKNVRCAFLTVFEPRKVQGDGEPRFSAAFILTPNDANCKAIAAALQAVAEEKWKGKAPEVVTKLVAENRVCYVKREKTDGSGTVYQGFEGSYAISASSKTRPTVVNRDRSPLVAADGKPYSGCYVNAVVDIWAQSNQYGQRLNATLSGVQFDHDGDAFTGGSTPVDADAFDDLGVDEGGQSSDSGDGQQAGSLF